MREASSEFKQREPHESVFTFLGSDHKGLPLLKLTLSILSIGMGLLICVIFLPLFMNYSITGV